MNLVKVAKALNNSIL
jgi:PAS domain-containing protein